MFRANQLLYKGVFACSRRQQLAVEVCTMFDEFIPGEEHNFFIVADEPGCQDNIEKAYHSKACLQVQFPGWLPSGRDQQKPRINARMAEIRAAAGATQQLLEAKKKDPNVITALTDIERLAWYLQHSKQLASARKLCHVTGWTTADNAGLLQQAFRRNGIHGSIRFTSPPGFSKIPVNMSQTW